MAENWLEHSKHTSTTAPSSGLVSRHQIPSPRRSRQRAESQSLHRWSAKYCPLLPPPRSTIAAAFSPDGKTLASTHGDHTVKIIDCHTGKCLKVLSGHRRTPWVVRYHPLYSDILASGSLDHEVRLWDANTSDCIGSQDFHRPIASIAFHARGEILAVASGHKLYIWNYNKRDESSVPAIILKTRRSLRAVHFHPHGAPYLLTAEVWGYSCFQSNKGSTLLNFHSVLTYIRTHTFGVWSSSWLSSQECSHGRRQWDSRIYYLGGRLAIIVQLQNHSLIGNQYHNN
nr:unnamed protein product [Digitaria exilis]